MKPRFALPSDPWPWADGTLSPAKSECSDESAGSMPVRLALMGANHSRENALTREW